MLWEEKRESINNSIYLLCLIIFNCLLSVSERHTVPLCKIPVAIFCKTGAVYLPFYKIWSLQSVTQRIIVALSLKRRSVSAEPLFLGNREEAITYIWGVTHCNNE